MTKENFYQEELDKVIRNISQITFKKLIQHKVIKLHKMN